MPKLCANCSRVMRSDRKPDICAQCASVCACGKPKDFRAAECISCGMRRKALVQWSDSEIRAKMVAAVTPGNAERGLRRRRHFADLREEHFTPRPDGRFKAGYWTDDGRYRLIYRHQWRWILAYGPIPAGHEIHHRNRDHADDDIANLEALPKRRHRHLHGADAMAKGRERRPTWVCEQCKETFQRNRRAGDQPRRFCSKACYDEWQRCRCHLEREP